MPPFAAIADRCNAAVHRHFGEVAVFTAPGWSASASAVLQLVQGAGTLAGQAGGTLETQLHLRESDYQSPMAQATVTLGGHSYRVQSVDPVPLDGMRVLTLRQGGL